MGLEQSLAEELENIPDLTGKVFPARAPEDEPTPYVVYLSSEGANEKSLNGFLSSKSVELELYIICDTYSQMKALNSEVIRHLQSFQQRVIGLTSPVLVEEVFIEQPVEMWDKQVNKYRCVIEFRLNI